MREIKQHKSRIPIELYERIKAEAENEGRPFNAILIEHLERSVVFDDRLEENYRLVTAAFRSDQR